MNCFKKCIFAVIQTTPLKLSAVERRCELLQKVYLCSNTNNPRLLHHTSVRVVNCFKKCIFAVIQTTNLIIYIPKVGCELLQKVYLCSNTNNLRNSESNGWNVVNCFKKCIFAVIQTTVHLVSISEILL